MTVEIFILLTIIGIALVLFSIERLPVDVVAIGVLLAMVLTGVLPADQAFGGFGSDAVVMIFGLLVLTAALIRTGVVDLVGRSIIRRTGHNSISILVMVMLAAALVSSLMSNAGATAFFIPVVIGLARRARMNASRLLMPLAFATILSSSVTLVATSTNIVVSDLMTQYNLEPMGMFELTPVGLPVLAVGLIYMLTIGRRLMPNRRAPIDSVEEVARSLYVAEVVILPGSPLIGRTLAESGLGHDLDLVVVKVIRNGDDYMSPQADLFLEEHDLLLVEGKRDEILRIRSTVGIDLKADVDLTEPGLLDEDSQLVEALLLPPSSLIGRTLKGLQLRDRYGLQVLAINRHGETIQSKMGQVVLQIGDVLLLQGNKSNLSSLNANKTFRVLGSVDEAPPNVPRARIAIGAFLLVIILSTLGLVTLPVAVLIGVLVVFVTRTITPVEAYREVEWKALILIGAMLGVGTALQTTGAAEYLANLLTSTFAAYNPLWVLGGFFVLTMLLTQPMSNQAAAAVVVPVAIQAALNLGLNPRTFTMMIAVAASCSFLTPLEPACLMVYGPGGYKFVDFLKVGAILTFVIFLVAIILVPLIWPI
jgi:di/tricarboxylate transporter